MKRYRLHPLAGILLVLSILLLGFSSSRVLPPAAAESFSRLVDLINTSARLGPAIRVTGVSIKRFQVELSLQLNEHGTATVVLTNPSVSETHVRSRWFALSTSSDKLTETDLRSLAALLDEVFQADPFIAASEGDVVDKSHESSFEDRKEWFIELVSMEEGIIGRWHVVAIVVLLIAATAVTAWQLLKSLAQTPGSGADDT